MPGLSVIMDVIKEIGRYQQALSVTQRCPASSRAGETT
jgi:hypothetical protein